MSYWGTREDANGDRHIVPCEENGEPVGDHRPAADCTCMPRKDLDSRGILYIHNDTERGGADA